MAVRFRSCEISAAVMAPLTSCLLAKMSRCDLLRSCQDGAGGTELDMDSMLYN